MTTDDFIGAKLDKEGICVISREEIANFTDVKIRQVTIQFEAALIANSAIIKAMLESKIDSFFTKER